MKNLSNEIRMRVRKLNDWQREMERPIRFSTKQKNGVYQVIRTYENGIVQLSMKKRSNEIVPFLDEFLKHYGILL